VESVAKRLKNLNSITTVKYKVGKLFTVVCIVMLNC